MSKKKKKKKQIRPLALCVFRRGNMIFVAYGDDKVKREHYYRPIGGGIDFGEAAIDTVAREVKEEIDADVQDLRYLGTLENIFVYNGKSGHEIVLIFDGTFVDDFRNQDDYVVEGMNGERSLYIAEWKPLDFFRGDDAPPLYPTGLLALLDES